MKLIVSKIPDNGVEEELKIRVVLNNEINAGEAKVFFRATRFGERVLIEGSVSMDTELECSRCLKRFSYPVDTEFHSEYIPQSERPDEIEERELTAEELDVSYYSHDEIDIDSLAREQLMVAVPMKPLCDSQCRGMCPRCGTNLNEETCDCLRDNIDPRLKPLKRLKIKE